MSIDLESIQRRAGSILDELAKKRMAQISLASNRVEEELAWAIALQAATELARPGSLVDRLFCTLHGVGWAHAMATRALAEKTPHLIVPEMKT